MTRKKEKRLVVSPSFHRMIKAAAAREGKSIIEFTEDLIKKKKTKFKELEINDFFSKIL